MYCELVLTGVGELSLSLIRHACVFLLSSARMRPPVCCLSFANLVKAIFCIFCGINQPFELAFLLSSDRAVARMHDCRVFANRKALRHLQELKRRAEEKRAREEQEEKARIN